MQETWFQSLCWEDPLAKKITTHYSILAWRVPWTVEPVRLQSMGSQSGTQLHHTHTHTHTHYVSESDLLKIHLESSSATIPRFPPAYNIL